MTRATQENSNLESFTLLSVEFKEKKRNEKRKERGELQFRWGFCNENKKVIAKHRAGPAAHAPSSHVDKFT